MENADGAGRGRKATRYLVESEREMFLSYAMLPPVPAYVPTRIVATSPRSVASAESGVSLPVAGFSSDGTPRTVTSKLLSSASTRTTWGATVRGTYGTAVAGTRTQYVLYVGPWVGASRPAPPVRTQRGRLVRVARTYPTEAPGVITSGPHAGAGAYVSAQVVTCPVRKAKRGRMTRTYGGWLG